MRRALPSLLSLALSMPGLALAYGEPDAEGSPNANERLLHVLTNQVRQAPHEWPGWDTSLASAESRGPLALSSDLLAAARFHGVDMANNGCFSHESCDGTPFERRITRYFNGPAGENIYTATGDPAARRAVTGWMNSSGHRVNILRDEWNALGTGFTGAGQIYYVQNFGRTQGGSMPSIPGGAYEILDGSNVQLIANHFSADGAAPTAFDAILGDTRVPLSLAVGPAGNQTYAATAALPEGCEGLFFVAEDAQGARATFPTEGALLVGQACTEAYTTERRASIPGASGGMVIDANAPEGGCRCAEPSSGAGWLALFLLPLMGLRRKGR